MKIQVRLNVATIVPFAAGLLCSPAHIGQLPALPRSSASRQFAGELERLDAVADDLDESRQRRASQGKPSESCCRAWRPARWQTVRRKKGRLATAFLPCFHNQCFMAYWGTVTVVASRTTADCASSLPLIDARFPNVIDV